MKREIEIEISPEGEILIKVDGVKGKKCLELTKALEEQLGVVIQRSHTSEYYQQEETEEAKVGQKKG